MYTLIKCELQRIFRKKVRIVLVLSLGVLLLLILFNTLFGVGFYSPTVQTPLNALNLAPFVLKDYHFYLILILCPYLVAESFNKEWYSGAYRMIMIRPYSRNQLYVAKLISIYFVIALFLGISCTIAILYGNFVYPSVSTTIYFGAEHVYNGVEAMIFTIKFYCVEFFILMGIVGFMVTISLLIGKTVLSYIASIFLVWTVGFGVPSCEFLVSSTRTIFDILLGIGDKFQAIFLILVFLAIGQLVSYICFRNNDYLE